VGPQKDNRDFVEEPFNVKKIDLYLFLNVDFFDNSIYLDMLENT
jgi:hypothetical protein